MKSQQEIFDERVELIPFSTCHWWTGSLNNRGYGTFMFLGSPVSAHRFAYVSGGPSSRPIPEGMDVCHSCDNRACVNPDHLWIGTRQENMQDMVAKGRANPARGERSGVSKLSLVDVLAIRQLRGRMYQKHIAEVYGISRSQVVRIFNGKTWRHIHG